VRARLLLVAGLALLVAADLALPRLLNPYYLTILTRIGVAVLAAASLQLVNGFTGQFSIGHAGFMAVGAYVSAALSVYAGADWLAGLAGALPAPLARGLYFPLPLLAGGAAAALAGFVVGIPALRLRGDYLAIATLGFGEIIRIAILNVDSVGGARGFSLASPSQPGLDLRYEGLGAIYAVVALSVGDDRAARLRDGGPGVPRGA
jgi:branched-chain amino acid transport system permease protein